MKLNVVTIWYNQLKRFWWILELFPIHLYFFSHVLLRINIFLVPLAVSSKVVFVASQAIGVVPFDKTVSASTMGEAVSVQAIEEHPLGKDSAFWVIAVALTMGEADSLCFVFAFQATGGCL